MCSGRSGLANVGVNIAGPGLRDDSFYYEEGFGFARAFSRLEPGSEWQATWRRMVSSTFLLATGDARRCPLAFPVHPDGGPVAGRQRSGKCPVPGGLRGETVGESRSPSRPNGGPSSRAGRFSDFDQFDLSGSDFTVGFARGRMRSGALGTVARAAALAGRVHLYPLPGAYESRGSAWLQGFAANWFLPFGSPVRR